MIDKKEIDYLYIATTRTLKANLEVQDRIDEVKEYALEHLSDIQGILDLIEGLEKAIRKSIDAESVVRGIIHYHHEEK
nr:MAG TPA: hypothetical protein [Crassvirales sp.]